MVLRLISLALLFPITLVDAYWAAMLDENLRYTASQNGGLCKGLGGLGGLGNILPWVVLLLGAGAAIQLIFRGRFGLSVALIVFHLAFTSLILSLLILGNGPCAGMGLATTFAVLSGPILFGVICAMLPVPILVLQVRRMRAG